MRDSLIGCQEIFRSDFLDDNDFWITNRNHHHCSQHQLWNKNPANMLPKIMEVITWTFTYARRDLRSTLLVSFGTPVACYSGHAVFAWTLTRGMIACFARCAHLMTIARWNILQNTFSSVSSFFLLNAS